jgi:hypothetical protein
VQAINGLLRELVRAENVSQEKKLQQRPSERRRQQVKSKKAGARPAFS